MWRGTKRWADWVRNDLLPLTRARRGGWTVHVRYEAADDNYRMQTIILGIVQSVPFTMRRISGT